MNVNELSFQFTFEMNSIISLPPRLHLFWKTCMIWSSATNLPCLHSLFGYQFMAFSLTNIVKLHRKLILLPKFWKRSKILIWSVIDKTFYSNPSLKFNHSFLYESSSNNEFLIFGCVAERSRPYFVAQVTWQWDCLLTGQLESPH